MTLRPCPQCRRHVVAGTDCPFCATRVAPTSASTALAARVSRAAVFAGVALAPACWSNASTPPASAQVEDHAATARGDITGRVTNAYDGQGISTFHVTLVGQNMPRQTAITDGSGRYVFKQLPPGDYTISWYADAANRAPSKPSTIPITVKAGETTTADLVANQPPPMPMPTPYGAPPARRRVV